ncbi:MAG: hypothetical protein JXB49_08740 [Bacteroidales bacterium]|nr:hypothetical protein [Bacteroidales bacterium]
MKRNLILVSLIVITFISTCKNESKSKSDTKKILDKEMNDLELMKVSILTDSCVIDDYSYESVLKFHEKGCVDGRWSMRVEADLNNDSINEVMLKTLNYFRGAFYVLYTKKDCSWQIVSDVVAANHFGIQINDEVNSGWHNFSTFESHTELIWAWRNGKYENIEIREIEH